MEKGNTQKIIWSIVAIVIVVAIIFFIVRTKNEEEPVAQNTEQSGDSALATSGSQPIVPVAKKAAVAPAEPTLTYGEALSAYAGRVMQFGLRCEVNPNTIAFKNEVKLMLDNRSPQSRTIKIGETYTIPGYGFKIITLTSTTFPKTFLVDCDGQQNVASILLQS